jgi:drug/metabolite transporter (DMT)-like permease
MMIGAVAVLSPDTMLLALIGADRLTVVLWRGIFIGLTLTVAMLVKDGRESLVTMRRSGIPGLVSSLLFAGSTFSFVFAVSLTTVANALVIVAASPLFAALFSGFFLREKVPVRTWLAALSAMAAVAFIFGGGNGKGALAGDMLAMITSMSIAANFVIIRKYSKISMIPATAASGFMAAVAAGLLGGSLAVSNLDLLLLAVMGTVVLPIPLAVMTIAPTLIPAAEVSLILLLETFLGPYLVWLAVREVPSVRTVIGGLLLVVVIALHSWVGLRSASREPRAVDC